MECVRSTPITLTINNTTLKNLMLLAMVLFIISCNQNKTEELLSERGYKYEILHKANSGKEVEPGDIVKLKIKVGAEDGTIFSESGPGDTYTDMKVPELSAVEYNDGPIPEVLDKSEVGDTVVIYVPTDSLPSLPPNMKDYKFITYQMYIHDAMSEEEFMQAKERKRLEGEARMNDVKVVVEDAVDKYKAGKLDLQKTDSGLEYIIHEKGTGEKINSGDVATVNYYGALLDKSMFDNSFSRGEAFSTPVGMQRVIAGWDEGLQLLNVGDKVTFFIPSELGYGKAGAGEKIPGDSKLVFYVEVENVAKH